MVVSYQIHVNSAVVKGPRLPRLSSFSLSRWRRRTRAFARTQNVSAAFIKELMRRTVQFQLERDGTGPIQPQDVDNALEEMLFSGGSLNVKLLGGDLGAVSV